MKRKISREKGEKGGEGGGNGRREEAKGVGRRRERGRKKRGAGKLPFLPSSLPREP